MYILPGPADGDGDNESKPFTKDITRLEEGRQASVDGGGMCLRLPYQCANRLSIAFKGFSFPKVAPHKVHKVP